MWHQVIGFAVFMAMSMVIVALLEVLRSKYCMYSLVEQWKM